LGVAWRAAMVGEVAARVVRRAVVVRIGAFILAGLWPLGRTSVIREGRVDILETKGAETE
jgi:hypothetical protein